MTMAPAQARPGRSVGARGFTLVELLTTVALLSILLALAAPSFTTWIRNTRVRTASDALQNGLRLAQAEAVRRNRQVVFSLTNAQPSLTSVAVANGVNWAIHSIPLVGDEAREFVQGGALADFTGGVTITGRAALCFNSAGRQAANPDPGFGAAIPCTVSAATPFVRYDLAATGSDRPLQITVSLGGQVRLCDPNRTLSATVPEGCPT